MTKKEIALVILYFSENCSQRFYMDFSITLQAAFQNPWTSFWFIEGNFPIRFSTPNPTFTKAGNIIFSSFLRSNDNNLTAVELPSANAGLIILWSSPYNILFHTRRHCVEVPIPLQKILKISKIEKCFNHLWPQYFFGNSYSVFLLICLLTRPFIVR